jgi:RND family efflux transporter MFP subunit
MYDGMKLKLDLTANGLDQAKLGLEMAKRRLAQATIRAPYDALIVNRLASVGTQVQVMPPTVVYRIQDAKNLRLKVRVPESVLRNVAVGDAIEARLDSAGLDVVARVDAVVTSVEPQLRTFEIVANLDNEAFEGKLRPGMFATVRIRHAAPEGAPILARENTLAVPGKPDEVRVFLLDGGKARERVVKVQSLDAATLVVTEGLKAGDLLVASDLASLRDGTEVKAGDAR